MVARLLWEQEALGSTPRCPTISNGMSIQRISITRLRTDRLTERHLRRNEVMRVQLRLGALHWQHPDWNDFGDESLWEGSLIVYQVAAGSTPVVTAANVLNRSPLSLVQF